MATESAKLVQSIIRAQALKLWESTQPQEDIRRLPLVNSRPILDLGILIGLIPLWWLLGVESLVLPVGIALISIKMLILRKWRIWFPTTAKFLAIFLLMYLISGLFIVEPIRWITFFRNFSVFLSIFLLHVIILNSVRSWNDVHFLLEIGVFLVGIAALLGFLAIIGIWRPTFTSPFGAMLPGWIANSSYGQTFVSRSLGRLGYFQVIGRYFRVKSLFTFPTLYASTLIYAIPIIVFLHQGSRSFRDNLYFKVIFLLSLINLIFTTGRTALLALFLSGIFYFIFIKKKNTSMKLLIVFVSLCIFLVLLASLFQIEQVLKLFHLDALMDLLVSGRGASTEQRLIVYSETIKGWMQRPVFGWGTERDIPEFKFPAGSHSLYLALLYRHGIVGFLVFLLVLYSVWSSSRSFDGYRFQDPDLIQPNRFLEYGRWVIFAAFLDAFTTVLITDILSVVYLWSALSLLVAARRFIEKEKISSV
jgi:O-Antigen ligase